MLFVGAVLIRLLRKDALVMMQAGVSIIGLAGAACILMATLVLGLGITEMALWQTLLGLYLTIGGIGRAPGTDGWRHVAHRPFPPLGPGGCMRPGRRLSADSLTHRPHDAIVLLSLPGALQGHRGTRVRRAGAHKAAACPSPLAASIKRGRAPSP